MYKHFHRKKKRRFDNSNNHGDDYGADSDDAFDKNNGDHDNISNNDTCQLNVNEYHAVTLCQHIPIHH